RRHSLVSRRHLHVVAGVVAMTPWREKAEEQMGSTSGIDAANGGNMSRAKRFLGRSAVGVGLVAASVGMLGCGETDGFTTDQWSQIEKLEPLKGDPPPNPFNNRSNEIALSQFGQQLF